jgi:hypothetical protein
MMNCTVVTVTAAGLFYSPCWGPRANTWKHWPVYLCVCQTYAGMAEFTAGPQAALPGAAAGGGWYDVPCGRLCRQTLEALDCFVNLCVILRVKTGRTFTYVSMSFVCYPPWLCVPACACVCE